jgi:hypothetical protein
MAAPGFSNALELPSSSGCVLFSHFCCCCWQRRQWGLTLPVLMEDSCLQNAEFGRAIGILYGVNTLGAVTAALLGEAYLVEAFGLLGTALTVAPATSIAAATALPVARRQGTETSAAVVSPRFSKQPIISREKREQRFPLGKRPKAC